MGDGGRWLRRQCLMLARNNNTPVGYWLSLTVPQLLHWIQANNELTAEANQK